MWNFRRKTGSSSQGTTALAEPPTPTASEAELEAAIAELTAANRAQRSDANERKLIELRHELGLWRLRTNGSQPQHPEPDVAALPVVDSGLPEIPAADVTAGLLRAGILRDGCLLVRGL